jgi:hypothetical protein
MRQPAAGGTRQFLAMLSLIITGSQKFHGNFVNQP